MLTVQKHNNIDVMSSVDLAELCGVRHDHFMTKAQKVIGEQLPNFREMQKYNKGNSSKGERAILMLPEREACLMAMSYSYELQAHVFDQWQAEKNKTPALPSVKELALMVIAAEEEKEKALLLVEQKSQHIESLESLFHSGGTIAQFAKQLNGINCQKINLWLNDNTNWLYDENKGKIDKHGRQKPYYWRCASYARDQYLTERPKKVSVQGMEDMTKYEVTMLAKGKKWLFKKYINGDLDCCMKANWDGKRTQEKDIK